MYDEFKYLKREVIAKPVEEINRVSDIVLTFEFKKEGRKIVAVRFLIKENMQQTLFRPHAIDEHAPLRDTETFRRLREHGIGERLAIAWILQDEARARSIVDYVEAKDRKKQIKGSTGGLIRSLIENPDAQVGPTGYELAKANVIQTEATNTAESESTKELLNAARRAALENLTNDDRRGWLERYLAEASAIVTNSYNASLGEFTKKAQRHSFESWLKLQLVPNTSEE